MYILKKANLGKTPSIVDNAKKLMKRNPISNAKKQLPKKTQTPLGSVRLNKANI